MALGPQEAGGIELLYRGVDLAEGRIDEGEGAQQLAGVGCCISCRLEQFGVRLAGELLGIVDLVPEVEGPFEHAQRLALVDRAVACCGE